jgi:immune inhibitor A
MVENRQKTGRDGALPGSGVAIWHIDENQSDNTNPLAYKVGLLQADGLRQLEQGKNSGDAGDLYRGKAGSNRADDSTNPSTRAHNGLKSKVAIGVAFSGANAKVKIKV